MCFFINNFIQSYKHLKINDKINILMHVHIHNF